PAAEPIWRATLKDQRPVVLTARILEMDKHNKDEITFIRHELNPKCNLSKPPNIAPYVEVKRVVWGKGGNVVLVVPMGREAFRVQDETRSDPPSAVDVRMFVISSPTASIPIAAPNGAIVGTLSIAGVTKPFTLTKNVEVRCSLATVMLSLDSSNLL